MASLKFLDQNGLLYFWQKIKTIFATQADLEDLEDTVAGIISEGGEPNVIETVKVNNSALTPDANKAVNITIEQGSNNGTLSVNGSNVSVKGLKSAAYTESNAYDAAGAASAVLGASTDSASANTVYGAKAAAAAAQGDVDALEALVGSSSVSSQIDAAIEALDSSVSAETNKAIASLTMQNGKITASTKVTVPTDNDQLANGAGYQTASDVATAVSGKANVNSPTFTGTPAAPTATAGTNTTQIATTAFVNAAVEAAQVGAAMFQGTVTAGSQISSLSSYKKGYYWVVATAGTYVGQTCEAGDMIFAIKDKASAYSASDFSVIQTNLDVASITNAEIDTILAA